LYWWSEQEDKSEVIYKKALNNKIINPDISFKMANTYNRLNKKIEAAKLIDSLIKVYPKKTEYLTFKNTLK
jgi:hypothetical protein